MRRGWEPLCGTAPAHRHLGARRYPPGRRPLSPLSPQDLGPGGDCTPFRPQFGWPKNTHLRFQTSGRVCFIEKRLGRWEGDFSWDSECVLLPVWTSNVRKNPTSPRSNSPFTPVTHAQRTAHPCLRGRLAPTGAGADTHPRCPRPPPQGDLSCGGSAGHGLTSFQGGRCPVTHQRVL